ncbi:unnamed protein product [Rotaria sp. Silwood2]|nr:unnamed protein product [Rotaria sp. Silwood2]
MGNGSSKKIDALEQQQKALMKQNAELAQRMAEQQEAHKQQHEATIEQMARLLLALADSKNNETVIRNEKRDIEIEGTTYEVVQFVNRGGFGEIYKAKVKNKNMMVAIKVMKNTPGLQDEIKNEINFLRLTKRIPIDNHPIIEFYGSKLTNEGIFIAMELAACDLVTFWINKVSEGEAQEIIVIGIIIIIYTLRALAFLEKLSIIHGDIKPQNLVIVPSEQAFCIKLIDFGTVEKLSTLRAQLTVDATKSHTLFFASPEFLRRDSKNLMSRHLHKKSDAWAAGVMFYLLFCGGLPWKDQFEYENFCNDPNAKDVVVPEDGGYKMIIELLLKKNPDKRSSAGDTIMQLKAHPVFGKIVESLHKNFCPVDDVCDMKVPDDVRQGLIKLARPGHYADRSSASSSRDKSGPRRSCRYGRDCYRKDSDHRSDFAHPGDSDYQGSGASSSGQSGKLRCSYGAKCFRDYKHYRSLVIFIGGVSLSISHAIVPTWEAEIIKHLTELKLFDESEKSQLGDNDEAQLEKNSNESVTDKEEALSFRGRRIKSDSSDNLLDRLSIAKPTMDTVRDILTRRRALDPAEKHNLIAYVRHRRESIFQHVIGYNYDDNSIVGGLYTRVGIGSKLNKKILANAVHLIRSF